MIDTLEKILPFLDRYPLWLRVIIGVWVLATAALAVLLILTPRGPSTSTPTTGGSAASTTLESEPSPPEAKPVQPVSTAPPPTSRATMSRARRELPAALDGEPKTPTASRTATSDALSPSPASEGASTVVQITDTTGASYTLRDPEVAYRSTFGPSKEKGIRVRRGATQAFLPWPRIRSLIFAGRKETNAKGVEVWHYDVTVELVDGTSSVVTLVDDWNMAYSGGGGPGLLFGQTELGNSSVNFSDIRELKVLQAGEPHGHR